MTDKQIIIDGVNVSGCKHYKNRTCIADYCLTDMPFSEAKCELNPNCYYKQLKRKEQECNNLKDKIKYMEEYIKTVEDTRDGLERQLNQLTVEKAKLEAQIEADTQYHVKEECNLRKIIRNKEKRNVELHKENNQLKALKEQAEQKLERIGKLCDRKTNQSSFCNGIENKDMQKLAIRILKIIDEVE